MQTISLLYELTDDDGNVVDNAICESTSSAVQVVHAPGHIAIVSSGTNEGTSNDMACDGAAVELTVEDVSLSDPAEFYVWDPSTLPSQPGLSGSSIGWESFEVSVSGTVTQTTSGPTGHLAKTTHRSTLKSSKSQKLLGQRATPMSVRGMTLG